MAHLPVDDPQPHHARGLFPVLATFAQLGRRLVGQRTKGALAVKRSQGVVPGTPPALPASTTDLILGLRLSGLTFEAVATELNRQSVPAAHGAARWRPSTVHAVFRRFSARR
jgi:DNA invertase Pin-like site-specific DNA recombinase